MNQDLHDHRFPGETGQYREARNKLLQAELELRTRIEELAQMKRDLPEGGEVTEDYIFEEIVEENEHKSLIKTKLSGLFEDSKSALIIYNFMYSSSMNAPCVMCTSILDAMEGTAQHLSQTRKSLDTATFDFGPPQQADEHGFMIGPRITPLATLWWALRRAILRH